MTKKLFAFLSVVFMGLLAFSATAHASDAVASGDGSLVDLAKPVFDAIMHSQWWVAASLVLVLLVAGFKRYATGKASEFAHSDVGGSTLILLGAFGSAFATGLMATGTGAFSFAVAKTALKVAIGAAGGYSLLKKLLAPILTKLSAKAPAWAKAPLTMLLWVLDTPSAATKAAAAGQKAVEAKPAEGVTAITGEPEDL